jgi:N-acetylneuraminate lyase/4-hydroxy-tetrahydrodipicolinate synthase
VKKLEGVIPALIMPFRENGEVHERSLKALIDFLIERKVNGVYTLGTFGCGPLLGIEERKRATELIVESVSGRVPVITHVGSTTAGTSVELAKHAEKAGVTAVAAVPPYYYQHPDDVVIYYYQRLLDSVSIPVIAYNNPPQVGYGISAPLLGRLAEMGVAGVKDSSFDIRVLIQYMNAVNKADFQFIIGTAPIFFAAIAQGATAGVSGPANVFPEVQLELVEEYRNGNIARCAELQKRLSRLVAIQGIGGVPYTTLIDMYELRTGREFGYPHEPMKRCTPVVREKIRHALVQEGFLPDNRSGL